MAKKILVADLLCGAGGSTEGCERALSWLKAQNRPVALSDLYRAFASHPKAKRNRHYRAKIRQVLQRGPFERVAPGLWVGVAA